MKLLRNFLNLFLQKYEDGLEESMRGSEFIFDSVDALYYNLNKVSLSRGESYIDSPKWIKNKKKTINRQNKKDDKCFQNVVTFALNCKQIKKDPQRISKIKPFIDQYNWKEIFHCTVKTGKSLNQIINQLLLIFCMCFIILNKTCIQVKI